MAEIGMGEREGAIRAGAMTAERGAMFAICALFLLSLASPLIIEAGPLRLSLYRIVTLLTFAPLFLRWISGAAGGVRPADIWLLCFCGWAVVSLLANHPAGEIWEACGILVAETFGPYLIARTVIRGPNDYMKMIRTLFVIICVLAVVGLVEAFTGRLLLNELFRLVGPVTVDARMDQRWGLNRAQGPFPHPILLGMFSASAFALMFYARGRGRVASSLPWVTPVLAATFTSLSSGAFVSLLVQGVLIGWDWTTRTVYRRWRLLAIITLVLYVTIDMLSNRTPVTIFIDVATFNSGSAWYRIHIWTHASAEVLRHPILGIGLNPWTKPDWMGDSLDNFWLLMSMRHGLPALVFLLLAFNASMREVGRAGVARPDLAEFHKAYLIALAGLMVGIVTVHLWEASYAFLMFLLGSGAWMRDHAARAADAPAAEATAAPRRYALG